MMNIEKNKCLIEIECLQTMKRRRKKKKTGRSCTKATLTAAATMMMVDREFLLLF